MPPFSHFPPPSSVRPALPVALPSAGPRHAGAGGAALRPRRIPRGGPPVQRPPPPAEGAPGGARAPHCGRRRLWQVRAALRRRAAGACVWAPPCGRRRLWKVRAEQRVEGCWCMRVGAPLWATPRTAGAPPILDEGLCCLRLIPRTPCAVPPDLPSVTSLVQCGATARSGARHHLLPSERCPRNLKEPSGSSLVPFRLTSPCMPMPAVVVAASVRMAGIITNGIGNAESESRTPPPDFPSHAYIISSVFVAALVITGTPTLTPTASSCTPLRCPCR